MCIHKLMEYCQSMYQVWFADDAAAAGSFVRLRQWWDQLSSLGPLYGYYPNASKTFLVVKNEDEESAKDIFMGSGVTITTQGKKHLGVALGSAEFVEEFVSNKVKEWMDELHKLTTVAYSQPQAAYTAFIHGTKNKWSYLCRTIPSCSLLLQPLEDTIHQNFIPAVTGRPPCSELDRNLLALPARLGGMGIICPTTFCDLNYKASKEITAPLVQSIKNQEVSFETDPSAPNPLVNRMKKIQAERQKDCAEQIYNQLQPPTRRLPDCACEPGASAWLSTLPMEEHGFCLSKGAFRDALSLRYGWSITNVSSQCACGSVFSVDHAMSCHKGGFPSLRHNEIRDLTAGLLNEACPNVSVEPSLQTLDSGPNT